MGHRGSLACRQPSIYSDLFMTCPRCHSDFEHAHGVCPECGVRLLRQITGVVKTSGVMIAAGEAHRFYRSVQDVPEPLRKQLIETTAGSNSGTILVADRGGREQLSRMMARREAAPRSSPASPQIESGAGPEESETSRVSWLAWCGFLLVLVIAGILAMLFGLHW